MAIGVVREDHFHPTHLCERLTDPRKLSDRHDIAEPKLDGPRAQLVCWGVTPSGMLRTLPFGDGLEPRAWST